MAEFGFFFSLYLNVTTYNTTKHCVTLKYEKTTVAGFNNHQIINRSTFFIKVRHIIISEQLSSGKDVFITHTFNNFIHSFHIPIGYYHIFLFQNTQT